MIDSITIEKYKSFQKQKISLGNLTIFTGLNNTGKSSAIQAIRMCLRKHSQGGSQITGLGGYSELRSKLAAIDDEIRISAIKNVRRKISLTINKNDSTHKGLSYAPVVQFISADRFGPRVGLPTIGEDISALCLGDNGEYSAHFVSLLDGCIVPELLRHPDATSKTLKGQLNWWMSAVAPGVKLDYAVQEKLDISHFSVDGFRPTNSGYGISYSLPIVLSLLTMASETFDDSDPRVVHWFQEIRKNGALLILENPEAHLHPQGQTSLGILAALAAFSGIQVVIETHSDHVLDGIRLATKNSPSIDCSKIQIYFFKKTPEEITSVEQVNLRPDGKLDRWPEGFFDQHSKNLRALATRNG